MVEKNVAQQFIQLLRNDSEYRRAWHDNIAMAFMDAVSPVNIFNIPINNVANKAAKNFLDLLLRETE